jgi:hypothetical protein
MCILLLEDGALRGLNEAFDALAPNASDHDACVRASSPVPHRSKSRPGKALDQLDDEEDTFIVS